ncbi:hypothetical protein K2173_001667 [Erythroxylum novogranatense]|uniref:Dof zinc finger protein n=1 Tax=Erythroxylum novogranatense TaxID=1862640 RepID=A0AAV8T443_9ROSI|nr:hypothetical protein K2173_001667 [Erythroxylum novogranatense]
MQVTLTHSKHLPNASSPSATRLQAQTLELSKPPQIRRQQGQKLHQSEPLKCPRCDSTNTKFCYYNNYNKSQPRHFCKTCKRHWTKGGNLRNVPIGGGRKNKRLKISKKGLNNTTATTTTITATGSTRIGSINNSSRVNPQMAGAEKQKQKLPLIPGDRKDMSGILYQALMNPPSSGLRQNSFNCGNLHSGSFDTNNDVFLFDSALSPPQIHQGLNFSYSTAATSYIDTHPSSISTSFQPPRHANSYTREVMEDSIITTIMPNTSSSLTQPWSVLNAKSGMDIASYSNWEDMDTFVSDDLNVPWDDYDIKP